MPDGARRSVGIRGRVFAVFDSRADAERAVASLQAAGVAPDGIEILDGEEGAAVFDASGRRAGLVGRVTRLVQFTLSDQMPDFAWYEAALRGGRTVVGVRASGQRHVGEIVGLLRSAGGHFINRFGLFVTEEFVRWRGPEPSVPEFLRR
jgi:hypothetical protein